MNYKVIYEDDEDEYYDEDKDTSKGLSKERLSEIKKENKRF